MYTQCPGCLTLFRVERRQLAAAGGVVRCGLCSEAFNALTSLSDRLPDGLPLDAAERMRLSGEETGSEPHGQSGAGAAAPEGMPAAPPTGAAESPQSGVVADPGASGTAGPGGGPSERDGDSTPPTGGAGEDWHLATALEVESAPGEIGPRRMGWVWGSGALLAMALLALQLLWFHRLELAGDPAWRPWVERLCTVAGCELPPPLRPDAVQVRQRTLRLHPQREGVLLFTATIANGADRPIAWPELGLRLHRLNGTLAGERWFTPSEYLAEGGLPGRAMPPDEPFTARVAVEDPGAGADNFEVRFR